MKLVAILPVRNEDWILGLSLRALLMWADEVVVALHACTDESHDIVRAVARDTGQVLSLDWRYESWNEMAQRQNLLTDARDLGATHIVTVDADEILTGDLLPTIRQRIEALPLGVMLRLPLLNLRGSLDRVHDTGLWGSRDMVTSVAFRDEPGIHWPAAAEYQHHCREPKGRAWAMPAPANRESGLLHLQFINDRRLKAKQALYKAQEVLRWPNRSRAMIDSMYSNTVYEHLNAPGGGAVVPERWLAPYSHLLQYLHIDREPWQEAELRRLIKKFGIERFAGLDLFGTIEK